MERDIWEDIDAARDEEDPQRRAQLCEILAERLRELSARDPDKLYALGYVLYNHPGRIRNRALQQETEEVLQRVLRNEPNHAWAKMYLGYNAYDLGRYDVARGHFADADASQLTPNFVLSRDEMILSSDIRTKGLVECFPSFETYVSEAERAEAVDVFPMSLARTLEELRPAVRRLDTVDYERLASLAERLDHAGRWTDWFKKIVAR